MTPSRPGPTSSDLAASEPDRADPAVGTPLGSARRWATLRRYARPGARGATLGLLVGAAPALLLAALAPSPFSVLLSAVARWTVLLACALPVALLAWWATRRWRAAQSSATVWGGVAVALISLLAIDLGLLASSQVLTSLSGEAENWVGWLTRALWLWLIGSMLLLWSSLTPGDLGLGRRMTPMVRRGVIATWVLAIGAGAAFGLAGVGDNVSDTFLQWPLNPLAEELFYRGLLLAVLVRTFGEHHRWRGVPAGWAVPTMAIVFGMSHHVSLPHPLTGGAWAGPDLLTGAGALDLDELRSLVVQIVAGLVMWFLLATTGSIWPAIAYHALHNSIGIPELQWALTLIAAVALVVLHRRRPRHPGEAALPASARDTRPSSG
jgi:membrane protease YdiL (CAAX protease family)